jgi:hypothetical protein
VFPVELLPGEALLLVCHEYNPPLRVLLQWNFLQLVAFLLQPLVYDL